MRISEAKCDTQGTVLIEYIYENDYPRVCIENIYYS